MTYLSRLTKLGLAKESTQGTYVAPTVSVPWDTAEYSDATTPLRDESVRANDVVLQGLAQGVYQADWALTTNAYPDFIGNWFVAMGLFDTVTGGVSTALSTNCLINATSISLTASVPNNSILKIADSGGANVEYVQVGTVTGSGPYVAPVTTGGGAGGNSTLYAHTAAGGSVISQYTHTFKQNRTFWAQWAYTATLASPAVFTVTGSSFSAGQQIELGGSVPTGFTAGTIYYVVSPSGATFSLAATSGGSAINSSSTGSGTLTTPGTPMLWPSYSFTTNDGVEQRGWSGCVADELAIKIDPKGLIKVSPKFIGWQSATQSDFTYAAAIANPMPGWGWTVTNGGGSSTRGLTMDLTLKRATEAIHASSGTRGPREVFAGALEADGTYKAIFENTTDITLFRNYIQEPTVHTLTQPIIQYGGSTLTLTMSVSGYVTAKVATSGPYQMLDTTMSGVANTTDGGASGVGVIQASLTNYASTPY